MGDSAQFSVLEHKLPDRIGLSLQEVVIRRNRDLLKGEDWVRIGRWIKYSEAGVQKLMGQTGVEEINPSPTAEWRDAIVTRCNFPNTRLIEVETSGARKLVRIKPEWAPMYRVKMKIQILVNGQPVATTRRPKGVNRFI